MSFERLILDRLDEHNDVLKEQVNQLHRLELEVVALKTHARIWGLIAGFISATGIAVMQFILR